MSDLPEHVQKYLINNGFEWNASVKRWDDGSSFHFADFVLSDKSFRKALKIVSTASQLMEGDEILPKSCSCDLQTLMSTGCKCKI